MDRTAVAYILLAGLVIATAAIIAWKTYNSHQRVLHRRVRRERAAHDAARETKPAE
jgi:predicted negative regulator of RcsB-dependent stress response